MAGLTRADDSFTENDDQRPATQEKFLLTKSICKTGRANLQNFQTKIMKFQAYEQVQQVDTLEDTPVLVEAVPRLEEVVSQHADHNEAKYAGCMGATAGCLTGGWCLALVCCTGCVYCAKQEGTMGDIARGCGSMGIQANVMARDIEEEHHVVDKSKRAAQVVWSSAKQANEDYQITARTKHCVASCVHTGIAFTKEHKLVERTTQGVGSVVSTVAKELASTNTTQTNNYNNDASNSDGVTSSAPRTIA